ncbi:MAG: hypothetical protein M3Z23_08665 [Acidobacteriota bacterium]|nr:hypothetical protein [Acidobacteriota bacterium]
MVSALALFFATEALIFRGIYPAVLEPESAAGTLDLVLKTEQARKLGAKVEVLVMGDSLISEGFSAKIANEAASETARSGTWHFSSTGIPGCAPRVWYYLLRELDPHASRYQAIVLPLHDYNDDGEFDNAPDRVLDLHWAIALLRYSDLFDFPRSFPTLATQAIAFRGILLKGLVYKNDVKEFLRNPAARLEKVSLYNRGFRSWWYDYEGRADSLQGLKADWNSHTFTLPEPLSPEARNQIGYTLFHAPQPARAKSIRLYRQLWFDKMIERYRNASTHIFFMKMPGSPLPHPVPDPRDPLRYVDAAVRSHPNVSALDEDLFRQLQSPDLFFDAAHLNAKGRRQFSRLLAAALMHSNAIQ